MAVADEVVELSEEVVELSEEVDVELAEEVVECVDDPDDAEDAELVVIKLMEDNEADEAVALPVEVTPRAVAVPVAPWTENCGEKL